MFSLDHTLVNLDHTMVNTPSLRAQIKPDMVLLKAGLREIDVIKRLNTYTQWNNDTRMGIWTDI